MDGMRKQGVLTLSSPADPGLKGFCLQVDEGDLAEVVRVIAVDGCQVTVGRWRWYHSAWAWVKQVKRFAAWVWMWLRIAAETVQGWLCGWRGHKLTRGGPGPDYDWLRRCWCGGNCEDVYEFLDWAASAAAADLGSIRMQAG